ncbi:hypothetical protein A4X09_0g3118 [Tilletia walkeri]|uniref:Signal peptidase complex subunit 2 n=1 Tax=Tilletia walkeri TaxID=117179 RepID=A0A8X7NBY4_9BASI|nr:hypothetical protein A4X09_0g3118 [Tilletia walkeri]
MAPPPPPPPAASSSSQKILIDNSNLSELKLTADEAVERILSSSSKHQAWTISHFHTDLRLALGYAASLLMIGVGVWSYFVEKDWEVNKRPTAVAVAVYVVLSAIQTADAYVQGNRIFYGSRKSPTSPSGPLERLVLSSPPLPKHKLFPHSSTTSSTDKNPAPAATTKTKGKGMTVPPEYSLYAEYFSPGSSVGKKGKVTLGHFGEWITEEGEFVESIFEERLRSGLAKVVGE